MSKSPEEQADFDMEVARRAYMSEKEVCEDDKPTTVECIIAGFILGDANLRIDEIRVSSAARVISSVNRTADIPISSSIVWKPFGGVSGRGGISTSNWAGGGLDFSATNGQNEAVIVNIRNLFNTWSENSNPIRWGYTIGGLFLSLQQNSLAATFIH